MTEATCSQSSQVTSRKMPTTVDLLKLSLEDVKRRGGLRSAIEDEIRKDGYYYLPECSSGSKIPKEIQLGWLVFCHIMVKNCMLADPKYTVAMVQIPPDPSPSHCIIKQAKKRAR